MSKKHEQTASAKLAPPGDKVKMSLIMAAVSATLRLVIPVMGLFLLGLAADALLGQTAFWAIVGAVLGFVVAAWLIWRQIKQINRKESE